MEPLQTMETPKSELTLHIIGMDCADCALTLEQGVARLEGIQGVQVHFATATLHAVGSFDPQAIVERVQALGYQVRDGVDKLTASVHDPEPDRPHGVHPQACRPELRRPIGGAVGFVHKLVDRMGFIRFLGYAWRDRSTAIALVGAALLLLTAPLAFLPATPALTWAMRGLHVTIVVLAGYPIARSGVRALVLGRRITIDLLMTLAALGAVLIGETGEAATVVVLFAIGEAMEAYAADRARDSLKSLLALRPERATVLRPCAAARHCHSEQSEESLLRHCHSERSEESLLRQQGYTDGPCPADTERPSDACVAGTHQVVLPVEQVQLGDVVLVRPGERIPVDGQIASGASVINQAPVTGESLPVSKGVGDDVYAGTVNGEAALEIQVTHLAADSTISRIVRLVEMAQAQRSPVERFIDRFARWYTPAVVLIAFVLATVPPLVFGAPFLDAPDGARGWLYRALSLLIVACPCSLVISTPVTVVSAMTALARRGVLVKGGAFLDALARVKVFALDKTGTLTVGQPRVIATRTPDCVPGAPVLSARYAYRAKDLLAAHDGTGDLERCAACDEMLATCQVWLRPDRSGLERCTACDEMLATCQVWLRPDRSGLERCAACDEMLALASAVERRSEHPLARAILAEAERRDVLHRYPAADAVRTLAGRGVEGTLNGATVTVGSHALFHERQQACALHACIQSAEQGGQTVMLVSADRPHREGQVLGFISVADVPRESGRDALHVLKGADPKVRVVMLTGDTPAAAQAVAGQVGAIDEVRAGLLPHDKLQAIRDLQAQYGPVAMIGDGVNDAPALAAADVGIAMGGTGTAQAMETADLVLMQDDLSRLADAVQTSRRTRWVVWQNIVFSLVVKAAILALALGGRAPLWMAVFADVGTSLLVTLNGMRMLRVPFGGRE